MKQATSEQATAAAAAAAAAAASAAAAAAAAVAADAAAAASATAAAAAVNLHMCNHIYVQILNQCQLHGEARFRTFRQVRGRTLAAC